MTRAELEAVVRRAFTTAGAIRGTETHVSVILSAADRYAVTRYTEALNDRAQVLYDSRPDIGRQATYGRRAVLATGGKQ